MAKITPLGTNPKASSEWRSLADWTKKDIPPYPGTYEICYAPGGSAQDLKLQPDDAAFAPTPHAQCDDLVGVLYIGKAVCFLDRFWTLIRTWRGTLPPSKKPHGSHGTWITKKLQSIYPLDDLLFRYMPIGKEVWRPKVSGRVDELRVALLNQDGNSGGDITSIASYSAENSLLRRYRRCFGTLPPLNTMGPQIGALTDEFVDAVIEDLGKSVDELNDDD